MSTVGRGIHAKLDREFAEAMARDTRFERDIARPIRICTKDLTMDSTPPFRVAKLWTRTSQRTNRPYLAGRWGGARVLVFENHERQNDDEPSHFLLLAPAEDKREGERSS